jgi:hypothetical protein
MNEEKKGLNLPAIRKAGGLSKQEVKKISTIELGKKSSVSSILKSGPSSIQKQILQSEKGLDLVLVGDLTSSMANYHALLKRKFADLCGELFPLIKNLRIGIIFYLDHGSGDSYVTRVQKLTTDTQELIHFINVTSTGHGGDADEAVEDALNDLNQINWKESNARSVVIFGDASPHPHNQCPHQHDFFNLTRDLFQKGVTINSVYCAPYSQIDLQKLESVNVGDFTSRKTHLAPPNFFSWIGNVTGGMVIGVENIDDLVDIIKASAAKDSGHLDDLEKKMKTASPGKLKLIEVARRAEKRKNLGGDDPKMLMY